MVFFFFLRCSKWTIVCGSVQCSSTFGIRWFQYPVSYLYFTSRNCQWPYITTYGSVYGLSGRKGVNVISVLLYHKYELSKNNKRKILIRSVYQWAEARRTRIWEQIVIQTYNFVKYSSNCKSENIKVIYSLVREDTTRSACSNEPLCCTKQVKCMASGRSSLKTRREGIVKMKHCASD